ncbi:transposase, partial [uncultured Muribaculum sp.]|uniref:transposase n=1 Tax=uncultured Muribaculum sp. TaxID=1918613 RepID=UPI0025ADC48F
DDGERRYGRVLITNNFEKDAIEIVQYYRRRWDIEVFFKFLKQDLSFSHFISTNVHGIQVMLYMTLIVALLVKIYSIAHNMGPRIAKQAIMTELIRYQTETIKRLEAQVKSMKSEVNNLKIKILSLQTSSDH